MNSLARNPRRDDPEACALVDHFTVMGCWRCNLATWIRAPHSWLCAQGRDLFAAVVASRCQECGGIGVRPCDSCPSGSNCAPCSGTGRKQGDRS